MFEFIEKVVYINLEDRPDRRAEIEDELAVFPKEKVVRFNAIREKNGNHGCSKSHIGALQMAADNGWENVLIMEDDCKWNKFETGYKILEQLATKPYDVISLGGLGGFIDEKTYKAHGFQTCTSYLVSKHYYPKLLNNFKSGLEKLIVEDVYHGINCIDQHWKLIQEEDSWFRILPHLVYQRPSFSDINKKFVDYTGIRHFNITE